MQFQISIQGPIAILTLFEGFMDDREVGKLRDAVRKLIADSNNKLVVDLAGATHMNSLLVGALVEIYTSYTNLSAWAIFANPREHVKNLLHLLKLDQVFEIVPSVAEAVERLKARERSASAF